MVHARCPICFDKFDLDHIVVTQCGHGFCADDLEKHKKEKVGGKCLCPVCRAPIALGRGNTSILPDGREEDGRPLKIEIYDGCAVNDSTQESPASKQHMKAAMRVKDGFDRMCPTTSAADVVKGVVKLQEVVQDINYREITHKALLDSLVDFKHRILPVYTELPVLKEKLALLQAENASLQDSLRKSESTAASASRKNVQLQKELRKCGQIAEDAVQTSESLEHRLTNLQTKLNETVKEKDKAIKEKDVLLGLVEGANKEKEKAQNSAANLQKSLMDARSKYKQKKEENNSLTLQLEQARAEASFFRDNYDSMDIEESLMIGEEAQDPNDYSLSLPAELSPDDHQWGSSKTTPLRNNPRHVNKDLLSFGIDFEGLPQPGFGSSARTCAAQSAETAKKRKLATQALDPGPSKKRFPIQTDSRGTVKGNVAVGKRYPLGKI